jgi:hypothetical protein
MDRAQLRQSHINPEVAGMECQIAVKQSITTNWVLTEHGWACLPDDLILYPLQESET